MGKEEPARAKKRKAGSQSTSIKGQKQPETPETLVHEPAPFKRAPGKQGQATEHCGGTEQPAKKRARHNDKQQPVKRAAGGQPPTPALAAHQTPHAAQSSAVNKQRHANNTKTSLPSGGHSGATSHHPIKSSKPDSSRQKQSSAHLPTSSHSTSAATPKHVFQVDDPRDHAETPFEAYRDLEPLLFRLAQQLGTPKASLRIYDPYFCAGSCVAHLSRLGFTDVYNRNEDFYAMQSQGRCPDFDVLVTNPPFSGDHMRRALEFAAGCGRPWALLVPDFVPRKSYYAEVFKLKVPAAPQAPSADGSSCSHPAVTSPLCGPLHYLGPVSEPYKFSAPQWHKEAPQGSKGPHAGNTFTPASFQCVWILALGSQHADAVTNWWRKKHGGSAGGGSGAGSACMLSGDVRSLPQLALDPTRKRREEEAGKRSWRKKLSRQRKNAAKAQARGS